MVNVSNKPEVELRVLGNAEVLEPGSAAFPKRAYVLASILTAAPGQKMSRAQIATELWEDRGAANGLANLRQLLRRVRNGLPATETVFGWDDSSIWLQDAGQAVDVCQFRQCVLDPRGTAILDVLNLYRGPLLAVYDLSDLPCEHSLLAMRGFLHDRYVSLVQEALRKVTRYGNADMTLLRRIEEHCVTVDPASEAIHRALILAYSAIGRGSEARRVFDQLSKHLSAEGLDAPEDETRALLTRLARKIPEARPPAPGPTPKIGEIPVVALLEPNWLSTRGNDRAVLRAFIEDIANELARYSSLTTMAAHSSFQISHDGGVLGASQPRDIHYTLASVIWPNDGFGKFSCRLVEGVNGSIVWSDSFSLTESLLHPSGRRLVSRIAREVAGAVENASVERLKNANKPSAYLHFLLGQTALKSCDLASVRRARRHYMDAIKEVDQYSEAHAGLANTLYLEWLLLGGNDPQLLSDAREIADNSVRLNRDASAGYWRKAMVALYQHDFDESERCFEVAQDLHPNSADIMLDHGDALGFIGNPSQAWTLFDRALELNPMPPDHYWWAGASIAFSQEKYLDAIEMCDRLDNDEAVLRLLAACHGQLGNRKDALEYGNRLKESYPGESAESLTSLQPHRTKQDLEPFVEGLRLAGLD